MAIVHHILKDGSRPKDITGHIVRYEDVPEVYDLMQAINQEIMRKNEDRTK